jgi:hypothetical protein
MRPSIAREVAPGWMVGSNAADCGSRKAAQAEPDDTIERCRIGRRTVLGPSHGSPFQALVGQET